MKFNLFQEESFGFESPILRSSAIINYRQKLNL